MAFDPVIVYYLWSSLLLLSVAAAWVATMFNLPGNWVIVGLAALFAVFYPEQDGLGIRWTLVAVAAALTVLGEVIEFAASAGGAAKQGASRRAMVLAIAGAIVGSIVGAIVGVPIALIGSPLGAIAGGAAGSFFGAYMGETWKGKTSEERVAVGTAAMFGRLFGTLGKLMVGAVLVVIVAVDVFF